VAKSNIVEHREADSSVPTSPFLKEKDAVS
jgi:hypothetical protein